MTEHVRDDQFFSFDPEVHEARLGGEPVTNETLERLAKMAEAPTGTSPERLAKLAGLTPGGKSLSGGGKHSPKFQVVLGEDTAAKVKAEAAAANMSVSKWIRKLLEDRVA